MSGLPSEYKSRFMAGGVSSMKLHRDLGVTQKTAWFMAHRIRQAFREDPKDFQGPVEVDETFMGGSAKNKHKNKKPKKWTTTKTPVVGIKDRDSNKVSVTSLPAVRKDTVFAIIDYSIQPGAEIFTDDFPMYQKLPNHTSVNHSAGQSWTAWLNRSNVIVGRSRALIESLSRRRGPLTRRTPS